MRKKQVKIYALTLHYPNNECPLLLSVHVNGFQPCALSSNS